MVEPELLDSLPPDDPDAIHSREDLRRVNRWMRNEAHLLNALQQFAQTPRSILEIGAGDGTFMLRLARRLRRKWPHPVRLYLLDMEPVIDGATLSGFSELNWQVEVIKTDLHAWLLRPQPAEIDLVMANLFLHHFSDEELRSIFRALSPVTRVFVGCEPRRWKPALIATRLLWLIGCNHVTRHDAYLSVRAGFADQELSALWPASSGFTRREMPAGLASHLFTALRACALPPLD